MAHPQRPAQGSRIAELDALRGLAALAVVLYHYTTRYEHKIGHLSAPSFAVPLGHYGVELFFVLSGFVIFMTLERTRSARQFLVSRASRLYPGYWAGMALTLLAIACLGAPFPGYEIGLRDVLWNTTMLQRYVPGTANVDGVYWTLSVELTFYAWALLLFCVGGLRHVRLALAGLIVTGVVLFELTAGGHISAPLYLRALRQLCLGPYAPYFAAGVLFHSLYQRSAGRRMAADLLGLAGCLGAIAWMRSPEELIASVLCFAIFGLLSARRLSGLCCRPLLGLGALSYSLYVVHQNVGYLVIRHLEVRGVPANLAIVAALGASLSLAAAVTYGVERPALRAIRRRAAGHPQLLSKPRAGESKTAAAA